MKRIDTYPGGLDKPHEQIEAERFEVVTWSPGGGVRWTKFKHTWNGDTVFVWCNEGYGLRMEEFEWDAIKKLAVGGPETGGEP